MREQVIKRIMEMTGATAVEFVEENGMVASCVVTTDAGKFSINLHGAPIERLLADDMNWDFINKNLCDTTNLVKLFEKWENVKTLVKPRFASKFRRDDTEYMNFACRVEWLDLIMTFHIPIDEEHSTVVNQGMLKKWGISSEEVADVALANIANDCRIFKLDNLLIDIGMSLEELGIDGEDRTLPLYVLTNTDREHGAVQLLNSCFLHEFCKNIGEDSVFIIPSSVDEVLLLPYSVGEGMDINGLIKKVNTLLNDTEILSDHFYIYDAALDCFCCSRDDVKISTYHIQYEGVDEFNEIRFCAGMEAEAIELFNNWCIQDMKLDSPAKILSIEKVFDESDALVYGDRYAC